ncbi:hypothetical protein Tcan_09788 [Toxocara canis]|uniref:Uncharacterized protein n=1 Tax=Toxocara canis TaxID=6265 RepID=A0A0B2VZ62_TOXCA|nr:hypothetical protein Tcan_09788 [Toxocara canis]
MGSMINTGPFNEIADENDDGCWLYRCVFTTIAQLGQLSTPNERNRLTVFNNLLFVLLMSILTDCLLDYLHSRCDHYRIQLLLRRAICSETIQRPGLPGICIVSEQMPGNPGMS